MGEEEAAPAPPPPQQEGEQQEPELPPPCESVIPRDGESNFALSPLVQA